MHTTTDLIDATDEPTAPEAAPARRRFHRHLSGRRVLAAVAMTVVAFAGVAATGNPASADTAIDGCQHGGGTTTMYEYLQMQYSTGFIVDMYVQHRNWNGSWSYTGASQRVFSTTDGWWMTASGGYRNHLSWSLRPGTGAYRLVTHLSYTPWNYSSAYFVSQGYSDNIYGATAWCNS